MRVCWVEVVVGVVEMGCCRVGMLVVLVDWRDTSVASMDRVLERHHQNWDLWVFVGMQYAREELLPDFQVLYWTEGFEATELLLCSFQDVQADVLVVEKAIHLNGFESV